MKNVLYIMSAALMICCFVSCEQSEVNDYSELIPSNTLYLPRDNYSVDLSLGRDVILEWASSGEGYVLYEVLFDTEDGDFSDPVYILISENSGASPNVTVSSSTLNTIATLAGCLPGNTINIKWTVKVWKGAESMIYSVSRTLIVTRANTVDPLPLSVYAQGSATENEASIAFSVALPVHSGQGNDNFVSEVTREDGAYECFTRLSSGEFAITDDQERTFILSSDGTIIQGESGETTVNDDEGIYWLYLNFNTMRWTRTEIEKVEIWNRPWFDNTYLEDMEYKGNGVWAIENYEWECGTVSGNHDTRYYFLCTYVNGSVERWGYFSDDCRQNADPDGTPGFYNVYRFDNSSISDEWADSWKTLNDSEGVEQKATFYVYMNNDQSTDYYHTRSFSD